MGLLLALVGGAWAIIGVANIVNSPFIGGSNAAVAGLLMFNVLLFVLPGLIVFALGYIISSKAQKAKEQKKAEKAAASNAMQCPFCAETIKVGAKVCRFCNRDLPEIPFQPEDSAILPIMRDK